jgi:Polyketide cyclase / dehydrase and lipid transport
VTAVAENKSSRPMDRLKNEAGGLVSALADRATSSLLGKVEGAAGRLTDYVEGGAGPGLMAAVTGAKSMAEGKGPARSAFSAGFAGLKQKVSGLFGGKKGGKGGRQKLKITNIEETIDVGVPRKVAYNQWTQFREFPTFMKKVENVDQEEDEKLHWKAQIFWSHREWDANIVKQVPDECIVWRSKGAKGHVDGAVTFHEVTPDLTRILLVLEYHPQGLFEHTGNIWRAQGRRARLELKHYRRHMMSNVLLNPDDVEGWRGEIEDGEVVKDHETALEEEQRERGEEPDEGRDEESAEYEPEEPEDREPEDEPEEPEELEDREPEDEPVGEPDGDVEPARSRGRDERPAPRRRASTGSAARTRRAAPARAGGSR